MQAKSTSLLACILAVALGGCVAAPVAQMAVSRTAPDKAPCAAGPNCQSNLASGSFRDMSKGISDSFRKLTGDTADQQTLTTGTPTK